MINNNSNSLLFVPAAGIEPALPRLVCFGRTVTGGCYLTYYITSYKNSAGNYILYTFGI